MKKRLYSTVLVCLLLISCLLPMSAGAALAATPKYRALCISEGKYLYENPLDKYSGNNVKAMRDVFKRDSRYKEVYAYQDLSWENKIAGDKLLGTSKTFLELIGSAFKNATASDISVLYFSGHGATDFQGNTFLCLVDNKLISASDLRKTLDKVPGQKVVILDICYAGNMIGKGEGEAQGDFHSAFVEEITRTSKGGELARKDYFVLTASSGIEQSWNTGNNTDWGANPNRPMGQFTRVVAQGLGDTETRGRVMADENLNGNVNLKEIYNYAMRNSYMSKPQMYPQDSNLSLYKYTMTDTTKPLLTKVQISPMASSGKYVLSGQLNVKANVDVKIIAIKYLPQNNNSMSYYLIKNSLAGGFKSYSAGKRSFSWNGKADYDHVAGGDYYFVVREKNATAWYLYPLVYNNSKPKITIKADKTFSYASAKEAAIAIGYTSECAVTIYIYNSAGKKVRTLVTDDRAMSFGRMEAGGETLAHIYYWNGRDDDGKKLPVGSYKVKAQGKYNKGATNTVSATIKVAK